MSDPIPKVIPIYVGESPSNALAAIFTREIPSIFLAGPSIRRGEEGVSWRVEALELLQKHLTEMRTRTPADLAVFIPEDRPGSTPLEFEEQVRWELHGLSAASCIAFWVPRNMGALPGLTTNIEFGMYCESGKMVFGAPKEAEHVRYMRYICFINSLYTHNNLDSTMVSALAKARQCLPFQAPSGLAGLFGM